MNLSIDERLFLRKTVLAMFHEARRTALLFGYDLKIFDGWRSISVQKSLFWFYLREFTAQKFGLLDTFKGCDIDEVERRFFVLPETFRETIRDANRVFVSWPSSSADSPSPHATGGAIDVWLYRDGSPVNLGVPFDWMEDDAGAFYHLKLRRKRFHGNDQEISRSRNILLYAMTQAGFSCYGPDRAELEKKYNKATFVGNIPNVEVFRYLSNAPFIISNSLVEGLPFSILEAMSMGVVPILSKVDGHEDLVIHAHNGFLFNSEKELANLLFKTKFISDESYSVLSSNAMRVPKDCYNITKENLTQHFKLYE
jgi:D-alanyl-D-alanine dipeptidase